ncbi:MAG: alpha-glucosidase C-terminal domain-containing protein, partial [Bacteroidales bacterium]|nr:alpha-glucosidase C-terminal domain-containing protein [Bacteroidales bacterium]
AVEDKALREGSSFDLNWVQQDNKDELFSFLRHKDDHTVLVVCNFSAKKRQTRVLIPQEAKDYVGNQSLPDSVKVCIKGFDFAVVIL